MRAVPPWRPSGWRRVALWALGAVLALIVASIGLYLGTLYGAGQKQRGYLALTGATVLAGPDLEPLPGGTVLIRDGVVIGVEPGEGVDLPPGADTIDLRGHTIVPGLIDAHVHLGTPELETDRAPRRLDMIGVVLDMIRFAPAKRRAFLEHGVTTVRSAGDALDWITRVRDLVDDGTLEGPRIYTAGPIFTAQGGHPVATRYGGDPSQIEQGARLPRSPDEAHAAVDLLARAPHAIAFVKVVQDRGDAVRPLEPVATGVLRAIVEAAQSRGLRVHAHWGTAEDLDEVLAAGVDGLEHIGRILDGWPPGSLSAMVARGVSLTPTLAVVEARLPADVLASLQLRVAEFHAAGGHVVAGSDAGMPGIRAGTSLHRELELLVGSGLTPQQALRAATSSAAQVLPGERVGVIAPGYAADLVAVAGDPLRDVTATRSAVLVLRDGRLVVDRRGRRATP